MKTTLLGFCALAAALSACGSSERQFASGTTGGAGTAASGSGGGGGVGGSGGEAGGSGGGGAAGAPDIDAGGSDAGAGGSSAGAGGMGGAGGSCSGMICSDTCVDVQMDSHNCGRCGHDCLGGACVSAVCQVVTIATGQGRAFVVGTDIQFVYWGGDGGPIAKKSLDNTGSIIPLVPAPTYTEAAYAMVVTPDALYWGNDWKDKGLRGCALPSCVGGAQNLVTGTYNVHAVISNATRGVVYYDQGNSIVQKAVPIGNPAPLTATAAGVNALAIDSSFVYWVETTGTQIYAMNKIPLAGGAITTLASNRTGDIHSLAVGPSMLYWAENVSASGPATIRSAPLPSGVPAATEPTKIADVVGTVRTVATDATHIYFANRTGNSIQRCPLAGCLGAPPVFAPASGGPWGLAVDARAVYWVTESGIVARLAK